MPFKKTIRPTYCRLEHAGEVSKLSFFKTVCYLYFLTILNKIEKNIIKIMQKFYKSYIILDFSNKYANYKK